MNRKVDRSSLYNALYLQLAQLTSAISWLRSSRSSSEVGNVIWNFPTNFRTAHWKENWWALHKGLALAVGLMFTPFLHEQNQPLASTFHTTRYLYYGAQNYGLPTKFWYKNQHTFEYSFRTVYLKRKNLQRVKFDLKPRVLPYTSSKAKLVSATACMNCTIHFPKVFGKFSTPQRESYISICQPCPFYCTT